MGVKFKSGEMKWRVVRSESRVHRPNHASIVINREDPRDCRSMIRALIGDALDLPFYHTLTGVGLERINNAHALNIMGTNPQIVPFVIDAILEIS